MAELAGLLAAQPVHRTHQLCLAQGLWCQMGSSSCIAMHVYVGLQKRIRNWVVVFFFHTHTHTHKEIRCAYLSLTVQECLQGDERMSSLLENCFHACIFSTYSLVLESAFYVVILPPFASRRPWIMFRPSHWCTAVYSLRMSSFQ